MSHNFIESLKFHVSLHPRLPHLLSNEIIEAAYIGGSSSRLGPSKNTDLDLFLVLGREVELEELSNLIRKHFSSPDYLVGDPTYLGGFGDFFKVLHSKYPIDIFSNSTDSIFYNRMMDGNKIIFDKSGRLTRIFEDKDSTDYVSSRMKMAGIDLIYNSNLLSSKLKKNQIVPSMRSYVRLVHALADLSMYAENPESLSYLGLREDDIIKHLNERFGIDYCDFSIQSMDWALQCATRFIKLKNANLAGFLHA